MSAAIVEAILLAWKGASWGLRIAAVVGPLVVLGGIYGFWHYHVYSRGYDAALAAVARADARAIGRATEYRRVFKECRATGRGWDQTTGRCA